MAVTGKRSAAALGATAALVFGVSGLTAEARSTSASSGTTPSQRAHGGPRLDTAALAAKLGVSESALTAALEEVRSELGAPSTDERAAEVKAIADALGVETSVVEGVLAKQGVGGPRGDRPTGTTPPKASDATSTTPRGDRGGKRGKHGKRGKQSRTGVIAALVKATGKSTSEVKAALEAGRKVHEEQHAARDAAFAKALAAKLGLEQSAVKAALDALRPAPPTKSSSSSSSTS